jgi:putative membrane protein
LTEIKVFGECSSNLESGELIAIEASAPLCEGRNAIMKNLSVSVIVAAVAMAMPSWVLAQDTSDLDRYGYGHMMWWGGQWYVMVLGPLFMILLLVLVIAVAVLFARWLGGSWQGAPFSQAPQGPTPLDMLKQRFARGEIEKEEYEDRNACSATESV